MRPITKSKSNSAVLEIQYGALPYRFTDSGGVEILLVTSRSRRRWILPKGLPVDGLEPSEAAAREAFEEAGVFDAATGARYRREILAVGGSRPALESFVAFRGREPEPDALLRSYGLAA